MNSVYTRLASALAEGRIVEVMFHSAAFLARRKQMRKLGMVFMVMGLIAFVAPAWAGDGNEQQIAAMNR